MKKKPMFLDDLSVEEVRLFNKTSDLWEKHSKTVPHHEELITNLIKLAIVSGEEMLFQFHYDDDEEVDYAKADLEIRKGKFISLENEEFTFGICIYYNGQEYTFSLYDIHIYHPVIYNYLSGNSN